MNTRKMILWITQTAMLLAVAVSSQMYFLPLFGGNPAGNLVVGSINNLCFVLATVTCGFWSGASISACTPFIAFMFGKIVYPQQLIIVALGNIALVFIFWLIYGKKVFGKREAFNWAAASVIGAVSKFLVLWFGMTKIFIEFVLKNDDALPAPQIERMTAVITANFTWSQLATALIGCILAFGVYKVLKPVLYDKAIKTFK
jgi:hypothetical protein